MGKLHSKNVRVQGNCGPQHVSANLKNNIVKIASFTLISTNTKFDICQRPRRYEFYLL